MADDKPITFGRTELDPAEEAAYRERIAKARAGGVDALKGGTPLGHVSRPAIPLMERHGRDMAASPMSETGGVQPRPPGSPLLRPETAQMIQDAAAQASAQAAKDPEKKDEEKVEEKKVEEDIFEMFDFNRRSEAERVLNNKERRAAIEARCEPMKLQDLIMKDEVRQLVPIVPGEFEVWFRSMTPDENFFIKRYLARNEQGQNDQYLLEKFGILQLVCTVVSINGREFASHLNRDGDVDEKTFGEKLKLLLKKSGYIVADLGLNYMWFDIRVRKLLNPEALGNG